MVLKGLSRFTGGEFLQNIATFIGDINELFGGFTERAKQVSDALRSPEVAFVLVTSPDPLAVQEAIFFADKLAEGGLTQRGIVINRVTPLIPEPPGRPAEVERALAARAPAGADVPALMEKLERALDEDRLRAVTDRGEVERLKALTGNRGLYVEVPAFEQDVHDLGALARVASFLIG
jgi:anion-transporting  ArsA/GET3 family ATPase